MSEESRILQDKLTEVVLSLKELTSEIKHLVKGHDETKGDIKSLQQRVLSLEKSQAGDDKVLETIRNTQNSFNKVALSIFGAVITLAVVGGLAFKLTGAS